VVKIAYLAQPGGLIGEKGVYIFAGFVDYPIANSGAAEGPAGMTAQGTLVAMGVFE
jgi:hypothetical protein